jgi:hypothetical protein
MQLVENIDTTWTRISTTNKYHARSILFGSPDLVAGFEIGVCAGCTPRFRSTCGLSLGRMREARAEADDRPVGLMADHESGGTTCHRGST